MQRTIHADLAHLRRGEGQKWAYPENVESLILLFTPRSGSTWLGSLIKSCGVLGFPEEYLNSECIEDANRDLNAASEYDFLCGCQSSRITPNRFFSMETTWGDISRLETVDFFDFFRSAKFALLRRFDLINQAMSLLVAAETHLFHQRKTEGHEADDGLHQQLQKMSFELFDTKMLHWMSHLVSYEASIEIQLAVRRIKPLRLYYEYVVRDPFATVDALQNFCHVTHAASENMDRIVKNVPVADKNSMLGNFIIRNRSAINDIQSLRPPLTF